MLIESAPNLYFLFARLEEQYLLSTFHEWEIGKAISVWLSQAKRLFTKGKATETLQHFMFKLGAMSQTFCTQFCWSRKRIISHAMLHMSMCP